MAGESEEIAEVTEIKNATEPTEIRPVQVEAIKEKSDKQLQAGEQWQSAELNSLRQEIAELKSQGQSVADLQKQVSTLETNLQAIQAEQSRRVLLRKSKRTPRRLG